MTYSAQNISVSINKTVDEVYRYASNPKNFPKWVAFIKSINKNNELWDAETEIGNIKIKFAAPNELGIIDHWVTIESGETIYNPIRVISNGEGSELIFTLFWMPGRTEKEFEADKQLVEKDLQTLKELMES